MLVAWRQGHWFNFAWGLSSGTYNGTARTIGFTKGGYQGGQQGVVEAKEWYVQNVFEEHH
jgi:hypothetical protein